MNTLPIPLTIAFLALSIFISGLSADLVRAQSSVTESMVTLTAEEQAWLAQHPEIVLGAPTSYPPMVIKREDGNHVGVLVDLFEAVSRQLNTTVRLHIEDSWADIQEKAQNREIDGLAFGGRDPRREALFNATDTVLPTYFSVFARSTNEYRLTRFSDLDGMRIGYKRAARPTRSLLEKLPSAALKPYDDHESLTQALLDKEIDVIVAWMSYDHWRKKTLQGTIDNILLIDEYPIEMVTYIRNDRPQLVPIMNKAIAALQEDELPRIIDKWFGQWPRLYSPTKIHLTSEEQAWLRENPHIRLATLTNQPPFSMMDAEGSHTGILADILALLNDAIGQKIETELVSKITSSTHAVAKKEGIYGSASVIRIPRLEKEYLFTDTYMETPFYIFTRVENRKDFRLPIDLKGKRVSTPRNHRGAEMFLDHVDGVKRVLADTPLEQMQQVVSGKADALIGYFTYPYLINKNLMVDLVMAFIAESDQAICIGVNPEHPVLHGILNKAIATIGDEKIATITAKWTGVSRQETPRVYLTEEEKAWLAEHPGITLGTSTSYPPHVVKNPDGTYTGVLPNLYEQISQLLDTRVHLRIEDSWPDIQKKAENREIDGLAIGGRDPNRDAVYNATATLYPSYFSVFAPSRHDFQIKSFSDLDGLRIGYKRGARPAKTRLEKLPSAILKPYDDHESMTQDLLGKEIDVVVAYMSYDHWRKRALQGTIDKIYMIEEYPLEMVIYIRKDWPELVPVFNKAIAALQENELPRIIEKWFGQWPQLSPIKRVPLTSEERAWLDQKHTVRVRIADWPPYLIVKDDQPPQGIVIEYLKLIGERTGIRFKHEVTDQPFAEFLDRMKQRQGPDMTAVIVPTPEREQYLSFSDTYIASPYVIFTREQDNPILDISGLTGKTLAVPRKFVVQEQLDRDYPEIRQALYDSDEAALQALATGQADAYIGNLTVASHIIHGRGFSHLRVAAASPFGDQALSMGNRSDWPELTSTINKALASIKEEEKTAIRNKYLAIKFEQGINKSEVLKWLLVVGGSTLGIVLIFVFWNRRLVTETAKRKDAEERLLVTFDNMPIAAVMIDKDESMYLHNKRFLELFGYTLEDIPTLTEWWVKAYPDEQYRKWVIETWNHVLRRSKETGKNIEAKEYKVTCKNGDVRDMETSGHFLGDRYLATLIDNTERNRTKDQLVEAKEDAEAANQAKSLFLANMSHDLRTPLNAILGFSGMLSRDQSATADQQEKLAIISRSGQHLLSMINDVLELSKIEAGSVELQEHPFDLVALVKEISVMIQSRANEKGISVTVEAEAINVPCVKADVGKLRQILMNLLSNAVKFTDEGGVTIRCDIDPIPEEPKCCFIVIEVEDTGLGIDPAGQAQMFEPFVQGINEPVRKGTGLGLSICKKYAEFMGGTIELESDVGKGSLFRLRLPVEITEAADGKTHVDDRPRVIGLAPTQKTWRILIADDNRENLLLLKSLLEAVGFVVLEAKNGKEAVAAFEKKSPDLIWMDMRMPVLDGYEATRRIRKLAGGDGVKIVAITASAFKEQRPDILGAGCDEVVLKPFKEHEIFETMARQLNVKYIYQEWEADAAKKQGINLTPEMRVGLPPDLLQELRDSVLMLNSKAIFAVIERIEPLAPDTAKGLQKLMDNFQTGLIRDFLGENDEQ